MNILLIGKNGQVGWELQRSLSLLGNIVAVDYFDTEICGDLTNLAGIAKTISDIKPDIVVNAAAHTAVDRAESERELAYLINARSVEVLAQETAKIGALLVHYSTDYVFDGEGDHYHTEDEKNNPLNVYGETKLAGELAISRFNPRHFIFRTSWVFATRGTNFAKTILSLADDKKVISIINDQYGAPTSAELLADCTALAILIEQKNNLVHGTYHLVASGETTWYDYAKFVVDIAKKNNKALVVEELKGIPTSSYPTAAKRPHNSRLSNEKFKNAFGIELPHWSQGVERVVTEVLGK